MSGCDDMLEKYFAYFCTQTKDFEFYTYNAVSDFSKVSYHISVSIYFVKGKGQGDDTW